MSFKKIKWIDILLLLIPLFFLFLWTLPNLNRIYSFDEVDYVSALKKGLWDNYTDRGSISFKEFLKNGLKSFLLKKHHEVSKYIRDKEDIEFLRHYHPPFYWYFAFLITSFFGVSEFTTRMVSTIISALFVLVIYFGSILIFEKNERKIAFISAVLFSFSPMTKSVSVVFGPHAMLMLLAYLSLFLLIVALKEKRKNFLYLSFLFTGFAFLTHEYWIMLFVTIILSIFLVKNEWAGVDNKKVFVSWHMVLGVLLIFIIGFILWPAGFLKFGFLKEYIFHAYNAIIKKRFAWGTYSILDIFFIRLKRFPLDTLLILFSFIYSGYLFLSKKIKSYYLPFFLYPLIFFLSFLRLAPLGKVYAAVYYPFLYILSAMVILNVSQKASKFVIRYLINFLIVLAVVFSNTILYNAKPIGHRNFLYPVMEYIKKNYEKKDTKILVSFPLGPILSYYLPGYNIDMVHYEDPPEFIASLFKNKKYNVFLFLGSKDSLSMMEVYKYLQSNYNIDYESITDEGELILFKGDSS